MSEPEYEVVIIGAGPGGIAAAHLLRKNRHHDFSLTWNAPTTSGAHGWTTTTPALPSTSPRCGTSCRSIRIPVGSRALAPGPELYRYFQDRSSTRLVCASAGECRSSATEAGRRRAGMWRLESSR